MRDRPAQHASPVRLVTALIVILLCGADGDSRAGDPALRPGDAAALPLSRAAFDWAAPATTGTALNLTVLSRGLSAVTVAPGQPVEYEVIGRLSDDHNEGLALFGFTLTFDGGPLPHADLPTGEPTPGCDNPMINFVRPWGITNPDSPCPPACGFGGTIIRGELVQVGGGQNTIRNTPDNAPFPIGPVLTGVAQTAGCGPAVLITGSLTAPDEPGFYSLSIYDVFANIIKEGETGEPFYASEAALVGAIESLAVMVERPPIEVVLQRGQPSAVVLPTLQTEMLSKTAAPILIDSEEARQREATGGSETTPAEAIVYQNFSEGQEYLNGFLFNWGPTTTSKVTNEFGGSIPNTIPGVWEADNATLGGGWHPGTPISSYELQVLRSEGDPLGPSGSPAEVVTELWDGDPLAEIDSAAQGFTNAPIAGTRCTFHVPPGARATLRCALDPPVVPPDGRVWAVMSGSGSCRMGWLIARTRPVVGSDEPSDVLQFQINDDDAMTDGFCCGSGMPCGPSAARPFCDGDPTGARQYCNDDDAEFGGSFYLGGPCTGDSAADHCANFWLNIYAPARVTMGLLPVGGEGNVGIVGNEIFYTAGGGRVMLEVRIGDWDPDDSGVRLRAYQAQLDSSGFATSLYGMLTFSSLPCATAADCAAAVGGVCSLTGRACVRDADCIVTGESCAGPPCGYFGDGSFGAVPPRSPVCLPGYLLARRPDYALFGLNQPFCGREGCPPFLDTPDFRWSDVIVDLGAAQDDPVPFPAGGMYAGTLLLDVSADAVGTFTLGLAAPPASSLTDQASAPIPLLGTVPAKITVLDCSGSDCQPNGVGDECELSLGLAEDCNENDVPDDCDLAGGVSTDCDHDSVPDECQAYGDADGDGTIDPCDACPADAADDADGDGVCAPLDQCPADAEKSEPGQCGCGAPDTDSDGDGVADCVDQCPGFPDTVGGCAVPAVSQWGVFALSLAFLALARGTFRRRR